MSVQQTDPSDDVTRMAADRPLYDGCQQLALPSLAQADMARWLQCAPCDRGL